MKKTISFIFALVLTFSVALANGIVTASDAQIIRASDGYEYTVNGSNATITSYDGDEKEDSLVIPDTLGSYKVTGIGENAFEKTSNIEVITLPSSISSVGSGAFSSADLEELIVDDENDDLKAEDGILFTEDEKTLISYPAGKEDIVSYVIPDTVTKIGDGAFKNTTVLKTVVFDNEVKTIGNGSFEYSSVESVQLNEGLEAIGEHAFKSSQLSEISIPSTVKELKKSFISGTRISSLYIPGSVDSIDEQALVNTDLESIVIGEGTSEIGDFAFAISENLEKITIPESVTEIGNNITYGCSDDLVIYCNDSSAASEYAADNDIAYSLITSSDASDAQESSKPVESEKVTSTLPVISENDTTVAAENNTTVLSDNSKKAILASAIAIIVIVIVAVIIVINGSIKARKKENKKKMIQTSLNNEKTESANVTKPEEIIRDDSPENDKIDENKEKGPDVPQEDQDMDNKDKTDS